MSPLHANRSLAGTSAAEGAERSRPSLAPGPCGIGGPNSPIPGGASRAVRPGRRSPAPDRASHGPLARRQAQSRQSVPSSAACRLLKARSGFPVSREETIGHGQCLPKVWKAPPRPAARAASRPAGGWPGVCREGRGSGPCFWQERLGLPLVLDRISKASAADSSCEELSRTMPGCGRFPRGYSAKRHPAGCRTIVACSLIARSNSCSACSFRPVRLWSRPRLLWLMARSRW